jgi:hypothetical protein
VREKSMAYVIQQETFTDEFKSKALLFTDVFASAIVRKYLGAELHAPFKSNFGSIYLNAFNYAAIWSMKHHVAQNSPFVSALEYSRRKNRNTPPILSLRWNCETIIQIFPELSGYDKGTFEKDTMEVLNMKLSRYTVKHLSREKKIHFEPFWNLERLGTMGSEETDLNIRINVIFFDTYLGYFFCNNVITGNLDEISSGI